MLRRLIPLPCRNVATMARRIAPKEPLVVILGSTGTGKSELAVELATSFNGEVINADAMQLYHGLPIITNKITTDEQRGIPHHLLSTIPLDAIPWDVTEFKRKATETIKQIRSRGKLPILVGGTQYYVDSLLFDGALLDEVQTDTTLSFPILEQSTEVMLEELRRIDPTMAERWHPNDRRKIQRSLEIYLHTGKPASELYAEQEQRKTKPDIQTESWDNLMFWVFSEREILCKRLDDRVDKMLSRGLLDEVRDLCAFKRSITEAGQELDMTKGIWQSIGFKQFEPYLVKSQGNADLVELQGLKDAALEDMKTATRRYANYQTRWIRLKQIPRLLKRGSEALNSLYLLDSTDASQYRDNVIKPATELVAQFLDGGSRPLPSDLSNLAQEVLTKVTNPPPKETPRQRTCESCQTVLVTEEAWQRHVKSAGHRRVWKRKKKLALVSIETPGGEGERISDGESSSPDLRLFTNEAEE